MLQIFSQVVLNMAPKVCVPADFGKHHIGAPSHGNLTFNMKEGQPIKANSIILSLNSPVIDNLTTDLHLTSVDVEDFGREAVDCFIEASYTGEVDAMNLDNFRDVNKMSHVFDISWLSARCEKYFVSYLDKLDSDSSYPDILFAVEEAVYLMSALKKRDFLNLVVKKMSSISAGKRSTFVEKFLSDLGGLTKVHIDVSIAIVKSDVHILVNVLIAHLEKQGLDSLDDNSRYILQNVNLSMCYSNRNDIHAKLFLTLEKFENICKEDFQLCLHLLKDSTSKRLNSASPVQLFCLQEYWNLSFSASFEKMASSESVTNLYIFFDGLYTKLRQADHVPDLEIASSIIDRIIAVKESRGWGNMAYDYVDKIFSSSHGHSKLAELVKESEKLVTKTDELNKSIKICEYNNCTEFAQNVFQKDGDVRFRVPYPELAEQKFMLSINSMEKNDPDTFCMAWNSLRDIDDQSNVPKFHFAFERHWDDENKFKTLPISWCGKPSCDMTKEFWNWGYIRFHSNSNVTLSKDSALVGSGGLSTSYLKHVFVDTVNDRCRLVAYNVTD